MQDPSQEFVSFLTSKIEEIEKSITSNNQAERESAKLRKKQLREVQKYVADRNNGLEDRINYVQTKYACLVRCVSAAVPLALWHGSVRASLALHQRWVTSSRWSAPIWRSKRSSIAHQKKKTKVRVRGRLVFFVLG